MQGWKDFMRLRVGRYCYWLTSPANVESLDLLHEHGLLSHAADYYVKAKLYTEAANCYHYNGQYDQAAAMLRQGGHFDKLVAYVRV